MSRRSLQILLMVVACVALLASKGEALGVGTKAPDIELTDLTGKPVKLGELRGKVVLVDFWASWCAPCRKELPVLDQLQKKYKADGLVVIGVNADEDAENMKGFMRRTPLSFTVVHDAQRKVAGRYAPSKMPSSYLIDRSGLVRHVQAGFKQSDAEVLEAEIKKWLGKR